MFEESFIELVRSEFPSQSIDISEGFELISLTLEEIYSSLSSKLTIETENKNLQSAQKLIEKLINIDNAINKIKLISGKFEPEQEVVINEETSLETEKTIIPNYSDYIVDNQIPHNLYEDFKHKRPAAFTIDNKKYEVTTWIEMLKDLCEVLYKKSSKEFKLLIDDKKMQGKKVKYFSFDTNNIRKPIQLSCQNIYIESNLSANSIKNIIIKLLQKYNYKISEFVVYFRADYTDLNNNQ